MSRRAVRRPPKRAPVKALQRNTPKGVQFFLDEVRTFAERGVMVAVYRFRLPVYTIVLNGELWMTRQDDGEPLGSFADLEQAVAAGDGWDGSDVEGIDDDPRGAA